MISLRSYFAPAAVVCAVVVASPSAFAQDGRITASINFGAQVGSGDFTQRLTPVIYDEPAQIDISQDYGSGVMFDLGGSMLLFGNIGASASYARSGGDGPAVLAGQIPHPRFFDQLRAASASADGLDHTENTIHLQVLYRFAASPKIDVTVGIGPSFFTVKQALVTSVDVSESGAGPVLTPRANEISDSAVGFNIGADVVYMVTNRYGAGLLLRYARTSAEFDVAGSPSVEVDAGGFQFGVGARVRF